MGGGITLEVMDSQKLWELLQAGFQTKKAKNSEYWVGRIGIEKRNAPEEGQTPFRITLWEDED